MTGRRRDPRHDPGTEPRAVDALDEREPVPAPAPRARRGGVTVDPSLRIRDPWSTAFVLGTVGVFLLILLNALVLGHGGALTPLPTPTPIVTPSPAPSGSAAPSGSPGATGAATPSPAAASPSVAPASAAPSLPPPGSS